ncbi:MAG: GTP cyclohydrolase I FolE [Actinobacteria bacterium]|jgi:GTP cyclohydrolase I|nr:GTP cyclohydrolase I FolE [Actinomycetota bacterium]MBT3747081.1 GTP cyclohydrolase I FolE [Actinomycetota bacterium]MBT3968989.1 GTP cyclohydrolase I FolE [Actinomycetota bacterium]MBT4009630.1 GTP cyclohydrolase I FolE [Actinomycetota bacterium]MBT4303290.1 GTP cyclohydrolase I FolE [Actinomycetota bacterium]
MSESVDLPRIEAAVKEILAALGEDPQRDGLTDTPARVARMYAEVCKGIVENPADHLSKTFDVDHDEMVMVKDIPFYSLCEHHMVPFFGNAHVAYIPKKEGRIAGLSKLARLVDGFASRLQVQERLTSQIAEAIQTTLDPQGTLVVIEAEHLCMSMRGVKKAGAVTVTSAVRGIFRTDMATRSEAMRFIEPLRR